MDIWWTAVLIYLAASIATLAPTIIALLNRIQPNPSGISFDKTTSFSAEGRVRLSEHYSRLAGTLGFWKNSKKALGA